MTQGIDSFAMPAIASVPQLSCKKEHQFSPKSEAELFVTSYRLQQFCERNNVPEYGCVMQLVRTLDKKFSELSDEELYDYFRIYIDTPDISVFKNPLHSVKKKGIRAEFTQSYVLYRNEKGYWKAELLLKDGDELSKKAVEAAFDRLGGEETVGEVKLVELKINGVKTVAWLQHTLAGVVDKSLICLPDGGQIMIVRDDEVEMHPISKERVVTPYNVYDISESSLTRF